MRISLRHDRENRPRGTQSINFEIQDLPRGTRKGGEKRHPGERGNFVDLEPKKQYYRPKSEIPIKIAEE